MEHARAKLKGLMEKMSLARDEEEMVRRSHILASSSLIPGQEDGLNWAVWVYERVKSGGKESTEVRNYRVWRSLSCGPRRQYWISCGGIFEFSKMAMSALPFLALL